MGKRIKLYMEYYSFLSSYVVACSWILFRNSFESLVQIVWLPRHGAHFHKATARTLCYEGTYVGNAKDHRWSCNIVKEF
jgi:hypothetical protein